MARIIDRVVGHRATKEALQQALMVDRVPSTYLFAGPEGVGKSKVALAVAQSLVCTQDKLACGHCENCLRIETKGSQSLMWVEPEGESIKVEQAREVIRWCSLQSLSSHRVIVVNDAHKLNPQAGNALLKMIEEPPLGTHFILVTSNLNQMLVTLRSRSQVVRFSPLTSKEVAELTQCEAWVAESSRGRVSLAETLKEHVEVRKSAFACLRQLLQEPARQSFLSLQAIMKSKDETFLCLSFWQQFFRDVQFKQNELSPLIHQDQDLLVEEYSRRVSGADWVMKTGDLEFDLLANADRNLGVENFLYQLKDSMVAN